MRRGALPNLRKDGREGGRGWGRQNTGMDSFRMCFGLVASCSAQFASLGPERSFQSGSSMHLGHSAPQTIQSDNPKGLEGSFLPMTSRADESKTRQWGTQRNQGRGKSWYQMCAPALIIMGREGRSWLGVVQSKHTAYGLREAHPPEVEATRGQHPAIIRDGSSVCYSRI